MGSQEAPGSGLILTSRGGGQRRREGGQGCCGDASTLGTGTTGDGDRTQGLEPQNTGTGHRDWTPGVWVHPHLGDGTGGPNHSLHSKCSNRQCMCVCAHMCAHVHVCAHICVHVCSNWKVGLLVKHTPAKGNSQLPSFLWTCPLPAAHNVGTSFKSGGWVGMKPKAGSSVGGFNNTVFRLQLPRSFSQALSGMETPCGPGHAGSSH